jgi:hypothetical protein
MSKITPFFTQNSVLRTIGDRQYRFYPIGIKTTFKLKSVAKQLGKAFATFTTSTDRDSHVQESVLTREDGSQRVAEDWGITPEMASLRLEQQTEAISDLIEAFAKEEHMAILAEIIMSSLRDEDFDGARPEQFLDSITLDILPDLLFGVVEANKGVLGPLSKMLQTKMQQNPSEEKEKQPDSSQTPSAE